MEFYFQSALLKTLILFITGILTSMFGTLVGGAAFITIPVMTALGIPLTIAISANAFSNIGLNFGGFRRFTRVNLIHYRIGFFLAFFAFLGSIFGSYLVLHTPPIYIKSIFLLALLSTFFSLFIRPKKGIVQNTSQPIGKTNWLLGGTLAVLLGAYSGFLGAGVGTLYTYGLVFIFHHNFLESTATKKIPGLAQAIGASLIFLINGKIDYTVALPLFIGMYLGAEIGAYYGVKFGNTFVRLLLISITVILLIKFLF